MIRTGDYVPCGCVLGPDDCERTHTGECEHSFKKHFKIRKIIKALAPIVSDPWILMSHEKLTKWEMLGRYRTQQEAITATMFEWDMDDNS